MSDPTQNPPPPEGSSTPPEQPPEQSSGRPPHAGSTPPPPPPSEGQGSYGTGSMPPAPPPSGGYQQGYQQPGYHQPAATSSMGRVGEPGELLPRFLARLIDYILLAVVDTVLVSILVVGVLMGSSTGGITGLGLGTGGTYAVNAVSQVLTAAIALLYFSLMEARLGQTVGKMVLKLQTRGPGGGHPTMAEALKRNAWVAIGVLGAIPIFGFVSGLLSLVAVITIAVTIHNNANHRGWHDDFAGGTTVYKIG